MSADQQPAAGRRWITPAVYGVLGLELAAVIVFAATYNAIDFRIYMWGGHAVLHDDRLYLALAYGHWFTYSPFAAIVFVPIAALPLAVARVGWDLVSVVALAYSAVITLKLAGYRPSRIMVAGVTAAVLPLDPMYQTLFLGQINLILLALILTDVWRVSQGRDAGIGVGIAAAIKLTPAIFIVFFLLARRTKAAFIAAGTFIVCGLIGFVIAPRASTLYWEHLSHDTKRVGAPYISNQSPYGTAIRIAEGPGSYRRLVDHHPARVRRYRPDGGRHPGEKAGLAGRDRGHRNHRAAGLADFLGASLGVDPARPGPAGAFRAPDRRGRRVPAVRAGPVLVTPHSGGPREYGFHWLLTLVANCFLIAGLAFLAYMVAYAYRSRGLAQPGRAQRPQGQPEDLGAPGAVRAGPG